MQEEDAIFHFDWMKHFYGTLSFNGNGIILKKIKLRTNMDAKLASRRRIFDTRRNPKLALHA